MPDDEIQDIESVLTLLGGRVVHGSGDFAEFAPELPPAMPDWSPVRTFGGYQKRADAGATKYAFVGCGCSSACNVHGHNHADALGAPAPGQRRRRVLGCARLLLLGVLTFETVRSRVLLHVTSRLD